MRLCLVVIALAAWSWSCSGSAAASTSSRPAWPKLKAREVDGGESLAPRAAARAIAAVAADDRPADKAVIDRPVSAVIPGSATSVTDKPAATMPAVPPPDEPINTEEIVIEIED